ncbi:MAG: pentapeptide repeat-containing protein [Brevirhabdus sp.]
MPEPLDTQIPVKTPRGRASVSLGVLVFGFGVAAGFLIAFTGVGFLAESAGLIVSVFLITIFLVSISGVLIFLLRKPILRLLFGVADTQLESFADPLAEVARGAADRDPERATAGAQDLLTLTLARYGWIATRRWVIASLTGLIAAMAALAGTALLFNQNQLLKSQMALMEDQNAKIKEQTAFLAQDVQLAEAARNAEITVEITKIAELLGAAMQANTSPEIGGWAGQVPMLDPATQIDQSLIMRISAASQASRPYRFLDVSQGTTDEFGKMRIAMQRRREELPQSYALMEKGFGWIDPPQEAELIDRPASPERGQLLRALVLSGVHEYEVLNFFGLDLSFAFARDMVLILQSMQNAKLAFADFTRAQILESNFGGAAMENARLIRTRIERSSFSSILSDDAKGPYRTEGEIYPTFLAGLDLSESYVADSQFTFVRGVAMNFDHATLINSSFAHSWLSGATFRGAVLLGVDFTGVDLKSVDFDGAYVFAPDFLTELAGTAAPESFRPERFTIAEVSQSEVMEVWSAFQVLELTDLARLSGTDKAWKITRVQPFEN